jgi:hypothetical protein
MIVILALASALLATLALRSYRAAGVQQAFYQQNFAPAVMIACGRGFVMPQPTPQALQDFLELRQDRFDCAALPAAVKVGPVEWNAAWVYLYRASATVWRITGVSWSALDVLLAMMCAAATVATYAIFRLAGPVSTAAPLAILLTVSPANLTHLLSLRDYSKAPFALGAIFVLALLVIRPMRPRTTILLAAAFGAIVGIGWGFRGDLIVFAPFGILVALFGVPASLPQRAMVAAAMFATFVIVAIPVLAGMSSSGCQFHLALLGLTTPVLRELGIAPAPYQFSDQFLDASVAMRVADYSQRALGIPANVLCSPAYEAASSRLFVSIASMFPSDLIAHAYGAALSILRGGLDLSASMQAPRPFAGTGWLVAAFNAMARISGALSPVGPLLFLAAVGATWLRSRRLALALAAFTLFLAAYPAIEFEERHWFHLRFLPWFSLVVVAGAGIGAWARAQWLTAVVVAAVLILALAVPLWVARSIQTRSVRGLIAAYQAAPGEPLPIDYEDEFVKVRWQLVPVPAAAEGVTSDLLAVTLDANACSGASDVAITARYEFAAPSHDFSTSMSIERPIRGRDKRLFIPVFSVTSSDKPLTHFSGFAISGAPATCIAIVERVIDRDAIPLWLQVQVPADLSNAQLYHSLRQPRMLRW